MYEDYYKLQARPFQLTPDPRFFFHSRGHNSALAHLCYGLNQEEGFIVVTGEIGAGKTTLVRALLSQLDADKVLAVQLVSTRVGPTAILRMVANALGLDSREKISKAGLLERIERFLKQHAETGKRALLVVDEVQNLPLRSIEELRMLSNFEMDGKPLVQSFLIGQQQFRNVLAHESLEQLRQRVIACYHIDPLAPGEVPEYIEHRLQQAGRDGHTLFKKAACTEIYRYTGGIPRRINVLCDRLLLFGFLEHLKTIGADTVQQIGTELAYEPLADGVRAVTEEYAARVDSTNAA
jgi:putative secretion ATPase (PEP-CTERM system associated)